jgi:hypothetical protein
MAKQNKYEPPNNVDKILSYWKKHLTKDQLVSMMGTFCGAAHHLCGPVEKDLENGFQVDENVMYSYVLIKSNCYNIAGLFADPSKLNHKPEVLDNIDSAPTVREKMKIAILQILKRLEEEDGLQGKESGV